MTVNKRLEPRPLRSPYGPSLNTSESTLRSTPPKNDLFAWLDELFEDTPDKLFISSWNKDQVDLFDRGNTAGRSALRSEPEADEGEDERAASFKSHPGVPLGEGGPRGGKVHNSQDLRSIRGDQGGDKAKVAENQEVLEVESPTSEVPAKGKKTRAPFIIERRDTKRRKTRHTNTRGRSGDTDTEMSNV